MSVDVDWVPDRVLSLVIEKLVSHDVPATIFATHETPLLHTLDSSIEVGLHPNFESRLGEWDVVLAELKQMYPSAIGGRSHGLFQSSRLLDCYQRHGLSYESNIFLPGHPHLQPVRRFRDLVSLPFFWSDDKHIELGKRFAIGAMGLDTVGLRVVNFHPVHIYMNTCSADHYASFRDVLSDPAALDPHRHSGQGIGTLFDQLLLELQDRRTATLAQVCSSFMDAEPDE